MKTAKPKTKSGRSSESTGNAKRPAGGSSTAKRMSGPGMNKRETSKASSDTSFERSEEPSERNMRD